MPEFRITQTVWEGDPYHTKGGRWAGMSWTDSHVANEQDAFALFDGHITASYSEVTADVLREAWRRQIKANGHVEINHATGGDSFGPAQCGVRYNYTP